MSWDNAKIGAVTAWTEHTYGRGVVHFVGPANKAGLPLYGEGLPEPKVFSKSLRAQDELARLAKAHGLKPYDLLIYSKWG